MMDSTMVDIESQGPWRDERHEEVRKQFVDYLHTSSYPEQFRGIAQGVKPPRHRDFRIIKKYVSVDPSKRDGTQVPCNLCGPKPKFKRNGMVIIDDMGWLYLIGPICGERHYEGRFRDEERRFDREEAKRQAYNYLLGAAPQIHHWRQFAAALESFVAAASCAHAQLKKINVVGRELRRAFTKQDGWLRVDEEIRVQQANGSYRTELRSVNVARVTGEAAVRTECNLVERLRSASAILGKFGMDEDGAISHIASVERRDRLPELAQELRGAIATLSAVRNDIESFQAFFSEQNYSAISRWAWDSRNPIHFDVICQGAKRILDLKNARKRYPVDVSSLLRPLPRPLTEN